MTHPEIDPHSYSDRTSDSAHPMMLKRFFISGRVQGVSYRYSMCQRAQELGLSGWCRNLEDGRVEALVQGPLAQLQTLMVWCHQGPPHARVQRVDVVDALAFRHWLARHDQQGMLEVPYPFEIRRLSVI